MVVRTIEMKKITSHVSRAKHQKIKDKISITGDFSNYKKRNKIIYVLNGGKIGENV